MLYICCSVCSFGEPFRTSPCTRDNIQVMDVNRRATLASTDLGMGHQGLIDLCALLNMPPPLVKSTFSSHLKTLRNAIDTVTEDDMSRAARELRKHVLEENRETDEGQPIDVTVSYDGMWSKRGFTANHGVGIIISMDTGEVLDRYTLSKVCGSCLNRSNWDKESDEYKTWYDSHKDICAMNYNGSSPSMETHAARVMWNRSVEKHNMKYKFMVCDGDSKSFHEVENTYGDNDKVVKLDCIGHVSKRMYRALENLKKSTKGKLSDGKFIGGGAGRLTATAGGAIPRLADLYRNAIRQNSKKDINMSDADDVQAGVQTMQNSIMAILHHECKTENNNERHKFCPPNTEEEASWCDYKRTGEMENKPHHLGPIFLDMLKPVFTRLSEPALLMRCLSGYTQNQNESFNSLIWKRCPKHLWRGPCQIEVAVNLAMLYWNGGSAKTRQEILDANGLVYGKHCNEASVSKDIIRVKQSEKRTTETEKKETRCTHKEKNSC